MVVEDRIGQKELESLLALVKTHNINPVHIKNLNAKYKVEHIDALKKSQLKEYLADIDVVISHKSKPSADQPAKDVSTPPSQDVAKTPEQSKSIAIPPVHNVAIRSIVDINPRLPEMGKIKIGKKGVAPKGDKGTGYRPPEKLNHFELVTNERDEDGVFIRDDNMMNVIGEDCKSLDIRLISDVIEDNFCTSYSSYTAGGLKCRGNGRIKEHQFVNADDPNDIVCNPFQCERYQDKKCKLYGILSVILDKSPRVGGVYVLRTTSYYSINNILASLLFIQKITGGLLAGIPLKLTLTRKKVPVSSERNKENPKMVTVYVTNIEFDGFDTLRKSALELLRSQQALSTATPNRSMVEYDTDAEADNAEEYFADEQRHDD